MQIILISSRTLGASELLLLPSLFSHLFFSLLFVFLPLLLFLKSLPPFPPSISSSSSSLPSPPPTPSPIRSLNLCLVVLSSPHSRPGLTLRGCPIQGRATGRSGRSGWEGVGDCGFWCHFLASQLYVSWSQAL